MSETEENAGVLLQKLDDHTRENFPVMFLDFNPYGVSGVLLIEMAKAVKSLYGEYSEMTPMLDHIFDSFDRALLSSASIDGKMRNSFLQKMWKVTQQNIGEPQKAPGMMDQFGDMLRGQNKNLDARREMRSMSGGAL